MRRRSGFLAPVIATKSYRSWMTGTPLNSWSLRPTWSMCCLPNAVPEPTPGLPNTDSDQFFALRPTTEVLKLNLRSGSSDSKGKWLDAETDPRLADPDRPAGAAPPPHHFFQAG